MTDPINVTPRPSLDNGHRLLTILCHASALIGVGIVLPLIVYLVTKDDNSTVKAHAAEAFNFHLSYCLWALLCIPLTFILIGGPLLFIIGIAALVLAIIGIVKAADDELYRYPVTVRLLGA
jgi:uncharacterized Tic20 family protein